MKGELFAVVLVFAAISCFTWLLSGTGILIGFSGMVLRVLLGFAMLFVAVRVCGCRTDVIRPLKQ